MKYIKNFKLFEAVKPESLLPSSIYDMDSYINYLAYIESGIANGNYFKDFRMWLVYTAFKESLKEDTFYRYREQLNDRLDELKSLIKYPSGYDGKDYYREQLNEISGKTPDFTIDMLLEEISNSIKYVDTDPKTVNDPGIGRALKESFKNIINFFLSDIFYPGKMDKLKNLKFLDVIDESTLDSLLINNNLIDAINNVLTNYAKMERNSVHLGDKFFKFLKTIGESDINILKNMELPSFFVDSIIKYFNDSPDSFKVADEIKKSNTYIYNKIKTHIPDLDTSADLGDLGF